MLLLAACDGDPGADDGGRDGGGGLDGGGLTDAGLDAGEAPDAGERADAGEPPDAAANPDASSGDPDAGEPDGGPPATCAEGLGEPCDDENPCDSGFECRIGRCAPQGRPECGGFAGATCPAPYVNPCLYYSSSDFGPCLKADEQACACRFSGWLDCR